MSNDQLATFTDRREAIALFDLLRGRDPGKSWPLLPILAFVAPGGSGKSLLLRYLRVEKSSLPDGLAAIPYAYLDFTLPHAPKDLLSILMELRDQLQQQEDGQGKHLVFPRFDLGALIAQAAATNEDVASLGPTEVRRKLAAGVQIVESLSALSSSLGFAIPYVAPLLAGLKFAGQIKPLKDLLGYLEDNTGWKWYRMHGTETGLGANATLKDVLLRLHILSMPGKPERDLLVNDLLPAAFLADLFDALLDTDPPRAWSKTANIALFLDGFEALQRASSSTATNLLHVLAIRERKHGKTDPLLLVIGSRDYLPGLSLEEEQAVPFGRTAVQDEQEVQRHVREWYAQWQQRLPADRRYLRPRDLYLTFELCDFGQEDTRSYLLKLGEQKQTPVFAGNSLLVQNIDRLTHGHPLYLALAAEAVLEAKAREQELKPGDFELAAVSSEIAPEHEDEQIRDYLLDLFLRQLSETERKELIFCAVPRFLDAALLRVILPSLDDIDRQKRWNYYRQLTFMSPIDHHSIVFHPLVRTLLLRQLPVDREPESDYYCTHTRIRDYFHALTSRQKPTPSQETVAEQAKIEEAYHALALGDQGPAIALGVFAQQSNLTLWELLLEAVAQAPTELMPDDVGHQAYDTLVRATRHHNVQDAVSTIILYTLLLSTSEGDPVNWAGTQNNLGVAYDDLPGGDREANLRRAIECYEAALQVYTREAFPVQWAMAQNNLGVAYRQLPGGDREANLRRAIECYEAALQVRTREAFPAYWAGTQNNLGIAYGQLPGGDQEANLRRAIECYEAALQVYTPEAFPVDWAGTQNNLGEAYRQLPGGDREANLRRAIECYEAALQVYTPEAFPVDWAMTQNNLGIAYSDLPGGDRETNLRRAIECYEAALQVRTREAFPAYWAGTQNNLGIAYSDLPGGDREANLGRAIECYEAALQVYTREAFPVYWAGTQNNLGEAYRQLPGEDQEVNLRRAIECYEAALQVYTREAFPVQWAMAQNNLGIAYGQLPGGDQEVNLRRAIECYEATLQVYTPEAFPVQWAMAQNNLGIAYGQLPGGDQEANLRRAIECFETALQVRTREAFPVDWATTQNNLGTAYRFLPGGDQEANLRRAIECYEAALQVRTHEAFPVDWATTLYNLGEAHRQILAGDRGANLRRAIERYEAALQVFKLVHLNYYAYVVNENLERARNELRSLE